ncbi:MAG: hypothetical protein WC370_01895 [Dehalococcoidales bacterium]|jgi:uncharacterized membrane protein YtjA (UPF0391 family)
MESENLVLPEADFVAFQRLCRREGFGLCYYGPEIPLKGIGDCRLGDDVVVKVERRRFSSVGIPYEVADWQRKEWRDALPQLKAKFFEEVRPKMTDTDKPQGGTSKEVIRQLADQLKTVFIAALLTLWTATLTVGSNTPVNRGSWLLWAIASPFAFLWLVLQREKIRWPKLKWVFPFLAVALLWGLYFLGGVSFDAGVFKGIAAVLFGWSILVLLIMLVVMTWNPKQEKLNRIIGWIVTRGGAAAFPLSLLVLISGIIMGFARLENAGMKGWWMTSILIVGVIIFIVVAVVAFTPLRREKDS